MPPFCQLSACLSVCLPACLSVCLFMSQESGSEAGFLVRYRGMDPDLLYSWAWYPKRIYTCCLVVICLSVFLPSFLLLRLFVRPFVRLVF